MWSKKRTLGACDGNHPPRSRPEISTARLPLARVLVPRRDEGVLTYLPVSNPLPSGEYATTAMPSSLAVFRTSISGCSMSSEKMLYSTWTAEIGCTACARRMVEAVHSERPIYRILPSLRQRQCLERGEAKAK